jgi:hypothetical protein
MSRLVRIPVSQSFSAIELDDPSQGSFNKSGRYPLTAADDSYLDRVAKYVPGEVLAFFVVINAILNQVIQSNGTGATMAGLPVMAVAVTMLIVCTILVPLFVWYVRQEGDAWVINAVVSTVAFPFWAYALGATAFAGHWDGNLAAIMLATVTVVSGLVSPQVRVADRQEQSAATPSSVTAPLTTAPQARPERRHLDLVGPGPAQGLG